VEPTILLVEDSADNRRFLTRALSYQGYTVTAVPDGEAALAAATTARPDLLLSDVYLPGIDGLSVMEHLRRTDPDLPILAFSAVVGVPELLASAALERPHLRDISFLAKPFALASLYAMVQLLLPIPG
jgi:two-component system, cell cycle sensor histidine kinase and response regulator CckA